MKAEQIHREERDKVFEREEVAEVLRISVRKADELMLTKQLPSFKLGRRRLVSEKALTDFIRKLEAAAR
jgi:excisionase family DNA binding protein